MTWLALTMMALAAPAEPFDGLEEDVAKALKAHGCPGVGVAVVKDGKVILARGFGVKATGKTAPVTKDTIFAIGSVSKSFTAAMVAMLVDDGKLAWDDPVRKHLPTFQMQDRYLSDEVTLRDCLSHRVGMPRNDLVWYGADFSRDQILSRVRKMKYDTRIRTTFVYNNILYMAAGQAAAKASGKTWDEFVAKRIFEPLGMGSASTSISKFRDDDDVATPHTKLKGKPNAVPWRNADNCGPAGSINASAADMAKYLQFQLAKGKAGEKRLVKKEVFEVMHRPQIIAPFSSLPALESSPTNAYGMGWFLLNYGGTPALEHGGNIDGMTASVLMLPEKKIGIVVLANLNGSLLPGGLAMDLADRVLGREKNNVAYTTSFLSFISETAVQAGSEPDASKRVKDTKPSFELKQYAGTYQDDLHGPMVMKFKDDKLTAEFNSFKFDVEHWHHDTFTAADRSAVLPKMLITFDQTAEGGVGAVRFGSVISGDFRFKRVK